MEGSKKNISIAYVCNVDWFFISHRLPLAKHALAKGYTVYLLTKDTGKKKELENLGVIFIDIPFERSGKNPMHELKCVYKLMRAYKSISPTLIHHITLKASLLGSLAAKLSGHKQVVNAISGFGYNFTDGRDGMLQKIVRRLINISFKSRYFHFILQNPDDLRLVSNWSLVESSNIHLIKGAGIDLNNFAYNTPVEKDRLIFLFPARLLFDKGIKELLDAAKQLYSTLGDKIKVVLVGDIDSANLASISEQELKNSLIPNYIEWIGFKNDMYPVYIDSDVVILPSYREGLPKSLIEACAVGRPIITTDVPGCKECVIDNVNGLLIEVKSSEAISKAIIYLVENSALLKNMGVESRKLAEQNFSIQTVVRKTFDVYYYMCGFTPKAKVENE